MTTTQLAAIEQHGRNLLAIFPDASERDPVKLCKKLRRLEAKAHALALRCCNGPEWPSEEAQDAPSPRVGHGAGRMGRTASPNGRRDESLGDD